MAIPTRPPRRALTLKISQSLRAPDGSRAGPVVVLGVGSELRADDAAGIEVARALERLRIEGVRVIEGGTAPENFTGDIKQAAPSRLVIVDSADLKEKPGTVRLIDPGDIQGISFGTHSLPLNVLADYIRHETGCAVTIIGIQARSLEFGEPISAEVGEAIRETVRALAEWLKDGLPSKS